MISTIKQCPIFKFSVKVKDVSISNPKITIYSSVSADFFQVLDSSVLLDDLYFQAGVIMREAEVYFIVLR